MQRLTEGFQSPAGYFNDILRVFQVIQDAIQARIQAISESNCSVMVGSRHVEAGHIVSCIKADVFGKRGKRFRMWFDAYYACVKNLGDDKGVRANVCANVEERSSRTLQEGADEAHVVVVVFAHGIDEGSHADWRKDAQLRLRNGEFARKVAEEATHLPLQMAPDALQGADAFGVGDLVESGQKVAHQSALTQG